MSFVALRAANAQLWTNSTGGKWEAGLNWSAGVPPSGGLFAFITNASSKTVTIDLTTATSFPATMTSFAIRVAAPVGSTNTLLLSNTGTNRPLYILNSCTITNGAEVLITNAALTVAAADSSRVVIDGNVTVLDGWLTCTNNPAGIHIGYASFGKVTVDGGWFRYGNVTYVGRFGSAQGTLTLERGTITGTGSLILGERLNTMGTVWVKEGLLDVSGGITFGGEIGAGRARMTVSNGTVRSAALTMGFAVGAQGTLNVAGGTIEVSGGFRVSDTYAFTTSTVWMAGGQIIVTNSSTFVGGDVGRLIISNGAFVAKAFYLDPGGTLSVNGGSLTANTFSVTGPGATVLFTSGRIATASTSFSNGVQLAVGDGVGAAEFHLSGGSHFFANGLAIKANSALTGCGTVVGIVTNAGTILNECGAGLMVFSNTVVNQSVLAIHGDGTVEFFGPVINTGVLDASLGTAVFHSSFVNNGIYLDAAGDPDGDGFSNAQEALAGTSPTNAASAFRISSVALSNSDMLVTWTTAGGRTNIVQAATDGAGNYSNVSSNILITGSGDVTTNYLDSGGATNLPARVYRVRLVP